MIIAGVGGQGIYSLTKVFWKLCEMYDLKNQGSIFKGGAQTLGSIHSEIRLFVEADPHYSYYSPEIPRGELDLMLGLEPWETLRYSSYFNQNTKIIMNREVVGLYMERYRSFEIEDPVKEVESLGLETIVKDYTRIAIEAFGNKKMVNYLTAADALGSGFLPFRQEDIIEAFVETVNITPETRRHMDAMYVSNASPVNG